MYIRTTCLSGSHFYTKSTSLVSLSLGVCHCRRSFSRNGKKKKELRGNRNRGTKSTKCDEIKVKESDEMMKLSDDGKDPGEDIDKPC